MGVSIDSFFRSELAWILMSCSLHTGHHSNSQHDYPNRHNVVLTEHA